MSNSGAAVIITLPASGGLALLTTTGKVIQLSVQGQRIVQSTVVAGEAKVVQTAVAAKSLAKNVAATTVVTTAPVITNPALQKNAVEFMEGFFVPGPPPQTPAGVLGAAAGEVLSK